MTITPTILTDSYEDVIHKLFIFEGLSKQVQIDLCDGVFGLEKTWLPYEEKSLPTGFTYEFDLMVNDWRRYMLRAVALGATRIVMHIDTMNSADIDDIVAIATAHNVYIGLSVSNDYPIETFAKHVNDILSRYSKVFVQMMGIKHIGAQGQPFDEDVLSRIMYVAEQCNHIEIQVDGSMNPETILKVKHAGATCAVVGSYLFKHGDPKKAYEDLVKNYQ